MSALVNYPANTHKGEVPSDAVLLTLSGGVDSTYALYKLLREGRRVVIHHVSLRNFEGREPQERQAVAAILRWLTSHGLTNWEYVETRFDYGSLTFIVRDIEIIRYITGIVLRQRRYRPISAVVASGIAEDPDLPDDEVERIRRLLEDSAKRPVELMRPIRHMPKAEVIAALPKSLFALTWYCRRPRSGQPCHKCRTCGHVDAAKASPRPTKAPSRASQRAAAAQPEPVPTPEDSGSAGGNSSSGVVADLDHRIESSAPNLSAPKGEWEEYARLMGVDPAGLTKKQIITGCER